MNTPESLHWFLKDESGEYGPMDFATLQQLHQDGTVQENTLVRHEQQVDWSPWSQHPLLHPGAQPPSSKTTRPKLSLKTTSANVSTNPETPSTAGSPPGVPDQEVFGQIGQIESVVYEKKLKEQRREMEKIRAEALQNMPFDWGNVILPLIYLLVAGGMVWLLRYCLVDLPIDAAKQPWQTFLRNTLLEVLAKERVPIVLGVGAAAIFLSSWISAWLCGSHHSGPRAAGLYGLMVQAFLVVPLLLIYLFTDRLIFSSIPLTAWQLWLILTGIGAGCLLILYFWQIKVYEYGIWSSLLHTVVMGGICGVLVAAYLLTIEKVSPAKFAEVGDKHFKIFQKQAAILYQRGEKKRELPE